MPSLYRLIRHPMMVGFPIDFQAIPGMTAGHLLFATVTSTYILVFVPWEARDLLRFFGNAYRKCRKSTRRFFSWPKPYGLPRTAGGVAITLTDRRLLIVPERQSGTLVWGYLLRTGRQTPWCSHWHTSALWVATPKLVRGKRDAVRVGFDTSGREQLGAQPAGEWQATLDTAWLTALAQPFSTLPAVKGCVEGSAVHPALLILLGAAVALALACGLIDIFARLVACWRSTSL